MAYRQRRLGVIRFNCPLCGKVLKVAEEKVGKVVVCPRCEERSVAPAGASSRASADRDEGSNRMEVRHLDSPPGLFSGMSRGMRCAVALVAGVGAFGLLLPFLSLLFPFHASASGTTASWAVILAPCTVVIVLVVLYGQWTACPRCRKWWARTKVETEFVDREVFDKGGVPFAKSLYRTIYQCPACRHKWSVMQADEYREPTRQSRKPRWG
jgi:transcription elongation factor Elf1